MEIIFRALFDRPVPPKKNVPYDLDVLLVPNFRFVTDASDGVSVQAKTITVMWNDGVVDDVKIPAGMLPWKASLDRYDGSPRIEILGAKLQFTFVGENGRRRKTVTIQLKNDEIRVPFGLDHEFQEIARKYMKSWGIIHD